MELLDFQCLISVRIYRIAGANKVTVTIAVVDTSDRRPELIL